MQANPFHALVVAAAFAFLSPCPALAWGSEGHRIIAEIAEHFLEPATAHKVRALLALDNETTVADVANWADQIRRMRPDTASWHFVDIPISAASYDGARDCPNGECVVAKVEQFAAELHNPELPERTRLEALKFVVHFVGDLHQPLHASDNGDRGGNEIKVAFEGRHTNLHAVWDSGILAPAVQRDERGYALKLIKRIKPGEIVKWQSGPIVDWANESHALAARVIYGELQHTPGTLPDNYEHAALAIVNEQLEKAGIRLAELLNTAVR